MADQPAGDGKKRGRPARKAETPAERIARLERDLASARREVEEAEERKLTVVGRAVLAEAEGNESFMAELRRVLNARVTSKAGKAELAALMGG